MSKYTIDRKNSEKFDDIKLKNVNFNFDDTKVIIQEYRDEQIQEYISYFASKLQTIAKEEDLIIFAHNIKTLKIRKRKFDFEKLRNTIAYYLSVNNTIYLLSKDYVKVIYHELLHMASTHYDKSNNDIYGGFSQRYHDGSKIGFGLDEGYTQYLAEKHFENFFKTYKYETTTMKIIENIIGEDKMLSLYLNANLYGLINEMEKYVSRNDIFSFIKKLDFVSKVLYSKNIKEDDIKNLKPILKEINDFLINLELIKEKTMDSDEEKRESMMIFLSNFILQITINGKEVNLITKEELIEKMKIDKSIKIL